MYYPEPVPQDQIDMPAYLDRELRKISQAIINIDVRFVSFDIEQLLPPRPKEGMLVVFAANVVTGGSAAGIWEYVGGAWSKL